MTKSQAINYLCSLGISGDRIRELVEALEEEKTAQWKMIGTICLAFKCSRCEEISIKKSNYCLNCGAKMESEVEK